MKRSIFTIVAVPAALLALGMGIQGCSSQRMASSQPQDDMYYTGSGRVPVQTTTVTTTTTTQYVDQTPAAAQATAPEYYHPGASNTPSTTTTSPEGQVTNNYYGDVYNGPGASSYGSGYSSPVGFYRPWYRPGLSIGFGYSRWSGFSPMIGYTYGCPGYYDPFWYTPPPPVVYSPWYNPYYGFGYNPYMAYYSPWYGGGFYDPYYYGYANGYYAGYYGNSYYYNNYYNQGYYDNGGNPQPPRAAVINQPVARSGGAVRTGSGRTPGVTPGGSYGNNPNQTATGPGGRVGDPGGRVNSGGRLAEPASTPEPAKAVSGRDIKPANTANDGRGNATYYDQPARNAPNQPARQATNQTPVETDRGRNWQPATQQPAQPGQPSRTTQNAPDRGNYYSQPVQRPETQPAQQPIRRVEQQPQPQQQPQPRQNYYGTSRRAEYAQPQPTQQAPASESRWSGNRAEQQPSRSQQAPASSGSSFGGRSGGGSSSGSNSGGGGSHRPR